MNDTLGKLRKDSCAHMNEREREREVAGSLSLSFSLFDSVTVFLSFLLSFMNYLISL